MNSKKSIWYFRAKSVRVTKSGTLTIEDNRKLKGKKSKQIIKKLLKKKSRNLNIEKLRDLL